MSSMFEQAFSRVSENLSFVLENQTGRPHKGGGEGGDGGGSCGSQNSCSDGSNENSGSRQAPTGGEQGTRFDPHRAQSSLDRAMEDKIYT